MSPRRPPGKSPSQDSGPAPSDITIDEYLHALIPPPDQNELDQLEANIVRDGLRDPLVVWTEKNILLDGHNRYEICKRRGIPIRTAGMSLPDHNAAKVWIYRNQLGRRNLPPYVRAEIVMALEKLLPGRAPGRPAAETFHNCEKLPETNRVEDAARIAGMSRNTYAKAKIIARKAPEKVKAQVRRKEKSIDAAYKEVRGGKGQRRQTRKDGSAELTGRAAELIKSATKFATIVVDPPWDGNGTGHAGQTGLARPKGQAMLPADILDLPVADLSAAVGHLYLWVPNESLPRGLALLKQWGFRYVTCLTWIISSQEAKPPFCGGTEHLLFAIRGEQRSSWGTWGTALKTAADIGTRGRRQESYKVVETCSPGPYLSISDGSPRKLWTSLAFNERRSVVDVAVATPPFVGMRTDQDRHLAASASVPTAANTKITSERAVPIDKHERLAQLLSRHIRKRNRKAIGPTRRHGRGRIQIRECRWVVNRLHEKEGYELSVIEHIINWGFADKHWQSKITSARYLRSHFPDLVAAANNAGQGPKAAPAQSPARAEPKLTEVHDV